MHSRHHTITSSLITEGRFSSRLRLSLSFLREQLKTNIWRSSEFLTLQPCASGSGRKLSTRAAAPPNFLGLGLTSSPAESSRGFHFPRYFMSSTVGYSMD